MLGHSQSGRPIMLKFLSLAEHLEVILAARALCDEVYAANPSDPGMAQLAEQFSEPERIEFLDKS